MFCDKPNLHKTSFYLILFLNTLLYSFHLGDLWRLKSVKHPSSILHLFKCARVCFFNCKKLENVHAIIHWLPYHRLFQKWKQATNWTKVIFYRATDFKSWNRGAAAFYIGNSVRYCPEWDGGTKDAITQKEPCERMAGFCQKHNNDWVVMWEEIMWSDDTQISEFSNNSERCVECKSNTAHTWP